MDKSKEQRIKEYLSRKISDANLILFTGAGFSLNACDTKGKNLPSSSELAKELWNLICPNEPFEEFSLKDVFALAKKKAKNKLRNYLRERLTVNPASLSDEYKILINQPWSRAYTLNIDDLFSAAQSQFSFRRKILSFSGNMSNYNSIKFNLSDLVVTYLNGTLDDLPENVTFSDEQYGLHMQSIDSPYQILSKQLLQYPFIFIGSELDEAPLWKFIDLRRSKGRGNEMRPWSFLVIPKLSPVKQQLLRGYNIDWIPQTFEIFTRDFLIPLEKYTLEGLEKIDLRERESNILSIPTVSHLKTKTYDNRKNNYLLGAEPLWEDVALGTVTERDFEKDCIKEILSYQSENKPTPIFIFTGTAGSGKTSTAMRVAASLDDSNVGWIDRNSGISLNKIIPLVESEKNLDSLFFDTPDIYGREFSQILSNLAHKKILSFIALVIRGNKVDRIINTPLFNKKSLYVKEFGMPRLTDNEIKNILSALEKANLLGTLKGKSETEQINIFKEKSKGDRQLIVAMIEATSGIDFEAKVCEEAEQLEPQLKKEIYYLVAVATSCKHYLLKDEILLGLGSNVDNQASNEIEALLRRGLLIQREKGGLQLRHRVIADKILKYLSQSNNLLGFYSRLAYIASLRSADITSERKRMRRLLKHIINHETLLQISSGDHSGVENLYSEIEDLQKTNHHFWLQRGCFMLAIDETSIAENYLNQSYGLNKLDPLVILSQAHLKFKKAINMPNTKQAHSLAENAYGEIKEMIESRGKKDPYPYHILGTQGMLWARKGIKDIAKRRKYLESLFALIKKGKDFHPKSEEIKEISEKLHREILSFAL